MRLSILALLAGVTFAQQDAKDLFNKPPAAVDKALRARIDEFYQLHVKQEFRKVEPLVAEDTKDFFYTHNKPAYVKCEVARIDYTDNFKKAKAIEKCDQWIMMPGFQDKPVTVPIPSTWKMEKGKWVWYVDQKALAQTPFGTLKPGPASAKGASPFPVIPENGDYILRMVTPDKDAVTLTADKEEQVTMPNKAPGIMTVTVLGTVPGVEAKLDHAKLGIGEKAVLTLKAGEGAQSGTLTIKIEETGEMFPLRVSVK